MLRNITVFALASARLAHASQRNTIIARNIANADTPGFRAQDTKPFDFGRMVAQGRNERGPKATRPGHAAAHHIAAAPNAHVVTAPATDERPDGNTVSLEEQMVKAAETRGRFELASALYAKNLSLLRTVLSRGR